MKEIEKLTLNNLKNCQKSLSRVIRQYWIDPNPNNVKYRTTGYLLKILIESYQTDKKIDLENEITEIKEILKTRGLE
jgi:hypothetical protein